MIPLHKLKIEKLEGRIAAVENGSDRGANSDEGGDSEGDPKQTAKPGKNVEPNGGSKKKPICDGSHLDNGFKG